MCLVLRLQPGETEIDFQRRLVKEAAINLARDEALVLDAGFPLSDLCVLEYEDFVVRVALNASARKNPTAEREPIPNGVSWCVRSLTPTGKTRSRPRSPMRPTN